MQLVPVDLLDHPVVHHIRDAMHGTDRDGRGCGADASQEKATRFCGFLEEVAPPQFLAVTLRCEFPRRFEGGEKRLPK